MISKHSVVHHILLKYYIGLVYTDPAYKEAQIYLRNRTFLSITREKIHVGIVISILVQPMLDL